MSREIKFRAWLKKEKKMVEPLSINLEKQQILLNELADKQWIEIRIVSFDDIEMLQYTGINDKHGIEIYEGDIVKRIALFKAEILESISCVEFEKGCFILKQPTHNNYLFLCKEYELEVIGNIYENKELLENEQIDKEDF